MMREKFAIFAAGIFFAAYMGADAQAAPLGAAPDSGVELRRQQEQMERLRLEREMQERREAKESGIEAPQQPPEEAPAEGRFVLRAVDFDASEILSPEVRDGIVAAYMGREVTLSDLYALVEKINALYEEQGYITCRAYLPPQTIHEGRIRIGLFEGRVGTVEVQGNAHTRSLYIEDRMKLKAGSVPRYRDMDEELRWFNATNDVMLHLTLKAGEKPGTTDFVLTAKEPTNDAFTLYGDNAGSETTGRWREGVYYTNRSLFGWRDRLTLGFLHTQGLNSFMAGYSYPLGTGGTRLELSYSTNSTKVIGGQYHAWGIPVNGHASALQAALSHPFCVTPYMRAEASFTVSRQHSVTDMEEVASLLDDTFTEGTAALAFTHYGRSKAFYHRHALTGGKWKNASLSRLARPSNRYAFYTFSGVYQMGAAHGQLFTLRTNLQISKTDDLRPSKQFFLGGVYSVRGYKENLLGAPNGFSCSLEYAAPVLHKPTVSLYGFLDYGTLWGGSQLAEHHMLLSTGLGLRAQIEDTISLDMAAGIPLRRTVGYSAAPEKVDRVRFHLLLNAQF
ncbi:ShlB/FhaC/HecB family hemolysin secretion/activation protein [Selenomonas sp.]|uniref:ShlB/FhaC/HecB family hemolysin secretion/activation protein n=1 Tax=Selenomonas sp. TaxID=2053611 RepID=UPI003FA34034